MVEERYEINSTGGIKLFCSSRKPIDPPRAVLFIVHGLGEHSGRYDEMSNVFVAHNIAVFSFDQRGHGQSGGKKGHANSINQLVEDMELALMKCRSLFLEIPVFLYGHSMGGQIVASYLDKTKSKEIAGTIISSAWFQLVNPPPSWQISLIKKLELILPQVTLSNGLDPQHISSVTAEVALYLKDPLIHDRLSIGLFRSLYYNGLHLTHESQSSKIPILVCHGERDQITSSLGSEKYANNLGEKAEFKTWPDAFHESHHDVEKEKVMHFYVDWIIKHII